VPDRRGEGLTRLLAFLPAAAVAAADLLTKAVAFDRLGDRETLWLFPEWLGFTRALNPGVTGGMLSWAPPLALTLVTAVAAAGVAGYMILSRATGRAGLLGLSLILGGAAGNLYDRIRIGSVRDFIDVRPGLPWPSWLNRWPTFNVADAAIVSGVLLLLLCSFLSSRKKPEAAAPATAGR
jgi:signal peptidase II